MGSLIKRENLKIFFRNQSILIIFLVLVIIMSFVSENFFSLKNLFNIIRQTTTLGILACGMTLVIIGGGIDLSIGSILSLVMLVMIRLQVFGYMVSTLAGIIVGLFCGLVNGVLIGKYKANYFMITLSTMLFFQGFALMVSGGYNLEGSKEKIYTFIGKENIFGIPSMAFVLVVGIVVFGIFLQKTTFGRRLYAIGLNRKAAFAAGISTTNIIMTTYIISGLMTGIAGVVLLSRITMVQPASGAPYLFDVVTAVILGGTSLSGGYGNIYKTTLGFIFLGLINNSMNLLGVPFEYQQMIKGMVLIFALVYDELIRRKRR